MARDFLHRRQTELDDTSKPVMITAARESYQDELSARKKRYFLLMSIRIPALLLAAGSLSLWHNPWIAMAIVAGSIPIPWIAVIGANDRPPLPKNQARMYTARSLSTPRDYALPPSITGHARPDDSQRHDSTTADPNPAADPALGSTRGPTARPAADEAAAAAEDTDAVHRDPTDESDAAP